MILPTVDGVSRFRRLPSRNDVSLTRIIKLMAFDVFQTKRIRGKSQRSARASMLPNLIRQTPKLNSADSRESPCRYLDSMYWYST